jgi:hypothetical protein
LQVSLRIDYRDRLSVAAGRNGRCAEIVELRKLAVLLPIDQPNQPTPLVHERPVDVAVDKLTLAPRFGPAIDL